MRRILTMVAVAGTAVTAPALAMAAAAPAVALHSHGLPDRPCAYHSTPMTPGCFYRPAAVPTAATAAQAAKSATTATTAAASARLKVIRRPAGVRVQLAGPAHASRGQTVRYTATAMNLGHAAVRGVRLRMAFPPGLAHLSLRSTTGRCSATGHPATGHLVTCTFRAVRAGGSASVTVRATVTSRAWSRASPGTAETAAWRA